MSKLVKGIVKGVKKIFKGIKKIFKKITSSTLGKILLAAAFIYVGGIAAGAWNAPGGSGFIATKLQALSPISASSAVAEGTASALQAANVVPAASTASTAATEAAITEAAAGGITGTGTTALAEAGSSAAMATEAVAAPVADAATAVATAPDAALSGATTEAAQAPGVFSTAGDGATAFTPSDGGLTSFAGGAETQPSIFQKIMGGLRGDAGVAGDGVFGWMGKNPVPTAMLASGVASAFGPDEMDLLKEQQKLKDEQTRKAFEGIGDIDLGFNPSKARPRSVLQRYYPTNSVTGG